MTDILYNYVLHYNHLEELWYLVPRDVQSLYFNGQINKEDLLKDKDVNQLIKTIIQNG